MTDFRITQLNNLLTETLEVVGTKAMCTLYRANGKYGYYIVDVTDCNAGFTAGYVTIYYYGEQGKEAIWIEMIQTNYNPDIEFLAEHILEVIAKNEIVYEDFIDWDDFLV